MYLIAITFLLMMYYLIYRGSMNCDSVTVMDVVDF